jgi:hypothetical protein
MQARTFERWVVVCTASFAVLSSVALTLAIPNEHPVRSGSDEPLLTQIRRGAAVIIQLYPVACEGRLTQELSCDSPYTGYYNRRNNAWVLTGRPSTAKDQIRTGAFTNAPDEPGNISLWGVLGTFDEKGNLAVSGVVLGSIKSVWQNTAR